MKRLSFVKSGAYVEVYLGDKLVFEKIGKAFSLALFGRVLTYTFE